MNLAPWQPSAFLHSRQENELWNAILSYRDYVLAPDDWDASFTFTAIDAPDPITPALLIAPESGPRFVAIINSFPFAEIFGVELEMDGLQNLPSALRNYLEEGIVSMLWRAIPDNRMGKAQILATGPLKQLIHQVHQAAESELQWLSISIEGIAPEPVTISVGLAISTYVSVIAGGALAPAAIDSGLGQALDTEAAYTLGNLPISLAELARLEPGDLVVLPHLPEDLVLLRSQGRCYAFRLNNEQWVCLGGEVTERYRLPLDNIGRNNVMSDEDTQEDDQLGNFDSSEEPMVEDINELSVVVDFDLGRMSIPLAQVEAWQKGVVVPLRRPALSEGVEVTIRANGQFIGIGDLVRIDDRVGVRITRLMSKAKPETQ